VSLFDCGAGRNEAETKRVAANSGGEAITLASLAAQPLPVHLTVNATSVSSRDESPELAELPGRLQFPKYELVTDLNYGRPQNFWQAVAQKNNIPFMDGLPALAHQALRSFALWTGLQVPAEEFLKVIKSEVI
jgi:shikimate dehydrogenase